MIFHQRLEAVQQSGGVESFDQSRHFADKKGKKVHQMRTSTLFDAKNFGFFEIYAVYTRTRGKKGGGSIFRNFCGRLLWKSLVFMTYHH